MTWVTKYLMIHTDGDGHIDFREFMLALYVLSNGTPEENLKQVKNWDLASFKSSARWYFQMSVLQIFRIFDIDRDGTVSQKEVTRIVKDLFHLVKKEDNPDNVTLEAMAIKAFKEMDIDEDGQVTKEEFVKACLSQEGLVKMLTLKVVDLFI